ncbi:CopD family protein [Acidovorax sp. 106]|uniref:CopD family protein n=1 Tax=Acidovorax sp. 106 TaxID=2135637 RepID=UPI000EABE73A|nr:putative membrane protein [Acidovorax sp. 106]
MLYATLKLVHLLAAIVWLGGMFFAHFFLRPAAQTLEPALRVGLMQGVLQRFFATVVVAVVALLASGLWMVGHVAKHTVQAGGSFAMPLGWTVMAALGTVMAVIFGYIRLSLFPRLSRAHQSAHWPEAGKVLAQIRTWVGINLALGLAVVAVATADMNGRPAARPVVQNDRTQSSPTGLSSCNSATPSFTFRT